MPEKPKGNPSVLNRKKKVQRVSSDTISSIKKLHAMIEEAEEHLKKMPGSHEPDTIVSVDSVLFDPEYHNNEDFYLVFSGNRIQVREVRFGGLCDEYDSETTLDKYDTSTRIRLAQHIPDLIVAAKDAEQKVKTAADNAVEMIEMAIAQSLEVDE